MIVPGDRVRVKDRQDPRVEALGDYVVTVVHGHPFMTSVVQVQGPTGAKVWIRVDDLYHLKESSL